MTQDNWLIERARKRNAREAQGYQAPLKAMPPIDDLWSQLQRETVRQAKVFTDALGDPGALGVETPPDSIDLSTPDGRRLTLTVDRERRTLSQTVRDEAGAIRGSKPIIHFLRNADGELTFNFGGLQCVAASILRRVIR